MTKNIYLGFEKYLEKTNFFSPITFFVVCIIFGLLYSLLSILRFEHFMMGSFDLSIYDQGIWQYSHFRAPFSTVREMNILGDHFSPILMLLSFFYWIWDDVWLLLIFQAMTVCLSAQLIYLVLVKWFKSNVTAFFLSTSFFLFLGLQYSLDYDFHLVSLSVLPISLILYGLFLDKKYVYWFGVVIAFLLKEDLPVIVFFIGLYEILILNKKRLGIITIVVSFLSFFLITRILMPLFQGSSSSVKNYVDFYGLGNSPQEMIITLINKPWIIFQEMFNSPIKIDTFVKTLGSFSFLPVLSPIFWIVSLPIWMERFLSYTVTRWQFEQYYGISLTPIIVLACGESILLIQKVLKKTKVNNILMTNLLAAVVLLTALVIGKIYHAPLVKLVHPSYYRLSETERSLNEMVALIPDDSSVSAQQPIVSHLSHRREIYWFPKNIDDVQYIALVKGRPAIPIEDKELNDTVLRLSEDNEYNILYSKNDVFLFKRKDE